MKTTRMKPAEVQDNWYLVDIKDLILGRVASKIATVLLGKNSADYTPGVNARNFVVVVNAEKLALSGKKMEQKTYFKHSGYVGGHREVPIAEKMEKKPEDVVFSAIKGMVPKNRLGRQLMTQVKVYRGAEHPHAAQKLQVLSV